MLRLLNSDKFLLTVQSLCLKLTFSLSVAFRRNFKFLLTFRWKSWDFPLGFVTFSETWLSFPWLFRNLFFFWELWIVCCWLNKGGVEIYAEIHTKLKYSESTVRFDSWELPDLTVEIEFILCRSMVFWLCIANEDTFRSDWSRSVKKLTVVEAKHFHCTVQTQRLET